MENEPGIHALETELASGDLRVQVAALEEAGKLVASVYKAAVGGLEVTNNPVIYADWLSRLGPSIVPELEALYRRLEKGQTKTHSGILLLYLGSNTGVSEVLEAVTSENPYAVIAATKLANAGVAQAIKPITALLCELASRGAMDTPMVATLGSLIDALTRLNAPIPEEVRDRMTAPGVPKWVGEYLPKTGRTCSSGDESGK